MQMTYTALFDELVRAEIDLWNSLEAHLRAHESVTVPQFQALTAVAKFDGAARVQDISEEMSITVGATSKVVDRLERDGLAVRESNPTDRRSSIVKLSPAGLDALARARALVETHFETVFGGAFPAERARALMVELTALRAFTTSGATA
jgi:DNA-binding MarR family transcriptional regulator